MSFPGMSLESLQSHYREVRGLELSALRAENALLKFYTRRSTPAAEASKPDDSPDEIIYQFLRVNQPQNVTAIHALTGITRSQIQTALIRLMRSNRIVATGSSTARLYHVRLPQPQLKEVRE